MYQHMFHSIVICSFKGAHAAVESVQNDNFFL